LQVTRPIDHSFEAFGTTTKSVPSGWRARLVVVVVTQESSRVIDQQKKPSPVLNRLLRFKLTKTPQLKKRSAFFAVTTTMVIMGSQNDTPCTIHLRLLLLEIFLYLLDTEETLFTSCPQVVESKKF
jgi:hypothetical protein